jgi:CO/xanthine dehydrogenase Mo-binding subunit
MDELAVAADADPLEFRLRYLDDPRAIAVLNAMAETAAWSQPLTQPARPEKQRGRGIAFLRYETAEAYVAVYAEVLVNLATGVVQVTQVVVAHDCGLIINPNGVKNQIQGNVLQGISRTLKEEVLFDANGVTNNLWLSRPGQEPYSVLQFTDVPSVQTVLLEQQTLPSWGAGEATIGAVPAAIGNAIFNATGVRLRTLPLTPARVLSALASG